MIYPNDLMAHIKLNKSARKKIWGYAAYAYFKIKTCILFSEFWDFNEEVSWLNNTQNGWNVQWQSWITYKFKLGKMYDDEHKRRPQKKKNKTTMFILENQYKMQRCTKVFAFEECPQLCCLAAKFVSKRILQEKDISTPYSTTKNPVYFNTNFQLNHWTMNYFQEWD